MSAPTFLERREVYAMQWARMIVDQAKMPEIDRAANKLISNKLTYKRVEALTGVPWFFIAVINWREASGNLKGVLHNGELIVGTQRKTTLVPAGRGPFATFEDAAVDAIRLQFSKIKIDSVEKLAYCCEAFNGWGYFNHAVPSAYVWAGSNIYKGGKYVRDGVWDANAKDAQIGVMPLLKRMMTMDASVQFGPVTADVPLPRPTDKPVVSPTVQKTAGGAIGVGAAVAVAAQSGVPWVWIIGGLAVAAVVGGIGYYLWQRRKVG